MCELPPHSDVGCNAAMVQMWETCDEKLLDECLAPDVQVFHPVMGHTRTGLAEVCSAVDSHIDKRSPLFDKLTDGEAL